MIFYHPFLQKTTQSDLQHGRQETSQKCTNTSSGSNDPDPPDKNESSKKRCGDGHNMEDDGKEDDEEEDDEDDQASESAVHNYLREISRDEDAACEVTPFHLEDMGEYQGNCPEVFEYYLLHVYLPTTCIQINFVQLVKFYYLHRRSRLFKLRVSKPEIIVSF